MPCVGATKAILLPSGERLTSTALGRAPNAAAASKARAPDEASTEPASVSATGRTRMVSDPRCRFGRLAAAAHHRALASSSRSMAASAFEPGECQGRGIDPVVGAVVGELGRSARGRQRRDRPGGERRQCAARDPFHLPSVQGIFNSMNGRICVVTGATHGIGRATARALAASGATVLVHGRDLARARAVAGDISRDTGNPEVRFVQADFAQLAQVRRLAQELHSVLPRLDVLINNAGLMAAAHTRSADGYELTFAVNHLAPFLLTNLLLEKLKASAPARVIVVASEAHRRATLDFGDLMNAGASGWAAYERSKLANVLFARELARRLAGTGVTVNALHPGLVRSHLFQDGPPLLRVLLSSVGGLFMLSPRQGAHGSVYLATASEVGGESGGDYPGCRRGAGAFWHACDLAARRRLDADVPAGRRGRSRRRPRTFELGGAAGPVTARQASRRQRALSGSRGADPQHRAVR